VSTKAEEQTKTVALIRKIAREAFDKAQRHGRVIGPWVP